MQPLARTFRFTRRSLATATVGAGLAASAAPAAAQQGSSELEEARANLTKDTESLRNYTIPIATEPAFVFQAR